VTIGGFGGPDPAPTASQLAEMVADGELKDVLTAWVKEHGTAVDDVSVGSGTLYLVTE
jgi:hypothetical protein